MVHGHNNIEEDFLSEIKEAQNTQPKDDDEVEVGEDDFMSEGSFRDTLKGI